MAPSPPPGFPAAGVATRHRRLLGEIVAGTDPTPEHIKRFGLPFAVPCRASWDYGLFVGEFTPVADIAVTSDILFGGYTMSLIDQFAGLVTYSVLPEHLSFLTVNATIDFKAPLRAKLTRAEAKITQLTERKAVCEVTVFQAGAVASIGTVIEVLLSAPGAA